jgi:hypothetical protein
MSARLFFLLVVPIVFGARVKPAAASLILCSGTNTLNVLGLPGCEQADKVFSGFNTLDAAGNGPSPAAISVSFSGTTPSGPITDSFTSAGWTLNSAGISSIYVFNDTRVDETLDPDSVITGFDVAYGAVALPAACPGPSGCDSIAVYTNVCTNPTASCIFGSANFGQIIYLDTAGSGITEQSCYGDCTGTGAFGSTSVTFPSGAGVTSMFVQNWVTVTDYDSAIVGISGYSNDVFETSTPEPGTFTLLGTALGLAAFCWKRHNSGRRREVREVRFA